MSSKHDFQGQTTHWVMMLFLLFIGYEWLISGINKLLSGSFVNAFQNVVKSSLNAGSAYTVYNPILRHIVLPYSKLFGGLIETVEVVIGVLFILLTIIGFSKINAWIIRCGMAVALIAAFLSLNIFFYTKGSYFISTEKSFDGGVSINLLLFLFEGVIFVYFYSLHRVDRRQRLAPK
ncbi:hypothetical protein GCM10011391_08120 [Pullulanibacillus camelliae]|uniref:DoxX family membrane protein n=1 Tax=Pullulanibacillus camelliae TaxID=1707096 RepID=A0A8J2VLK9_9BACL|nr:hypothetical protein [Pullulanibacillus camelliae]GGE31822.1 hypothetical protein GCM10011391_08120 [Pullulanibacillus camelliae]